MNKLTIFINSPLEQFEVSSLLSFNAPILGYLNLNFKLIALELACLSLILVYDFYHIVKISHFLFTHPVQPN